MTPTLRNAVLALALLALGAANGVWWARHRAAPADTAAPGSAAMAPAAPPAPSGSAAPGSAAPGGPTEPAPGSLPGAPEGSVAGIATVHPQGRRILYWFDPMKPDQKFDKPGKSPFMDMELKPRYAEDGDTGAPDGASPGKPGSAGASAPAPTSGKLGRVGIPPVAGSPAAAGSTVTAGDPGTPALTLSPQSSQSLGMRLARVERRALAPAVEAVGTVQLSERDVSIVQARTAGFVERVYAHAPGDVIAAGSPLVDVLNPEWAGAQQEYLAVRAAGEPALTAAARQRMLLLGMSAALIERVEQANAPIPVVTLTAPTSGVIAELQVRTGMALTAGATLARINGLSTVWLELAVAEADASQIAVGQAVEARFPALADTVRRGRVLAILPEANPDTRTLRVRVELPNPGQRLRAGLFAQASLHGPAQSALVVPAEAVIRTGKRAIVYVTGKAGQFRPVVVETGIERDGLLEVRSGLAEGQQVVASGQFLLDSEASMRGILPPSGTRP